MSDYNSSLPIRTENNGDAAVKVVDGTVTSQALNVDAAGKVTAKLNDGAGNSVTSQASGGQQALDVGINVAGVQVDPRQIRTLTSGDTVTADQGAPNTAANGWPVKPTDGTNSQLYTAAGEATVSVTQPLPAGTNTIGSVKVTDGTDTLNITAAGEATVSVTQPLPTGTNTIGGVTQSGNWSVRNQDGAGNNLTSSAAGATRPLDVALRDSAGNLYSGSNPLPVSISVDQFGDEINNYSTAAAVAAAGTSNHDYTVSVGKTLQLKQIEATASGKAKIEVQIETAAASGTFNTRFVQFNSTATPNMSIHLEDPISVATGVRVRIIRTNKDNQAQDLYSTISGQEV